MTVSSMFGTKREKANAQQYKADGTPGSRAKHAAVRRSKRKNVLVIDVGGTSVKILATGQTEPILSIRTDAHSQTDGIESEKACRGLGV